jgi:hypothetical protein
MLSVALHRAVLGVSRFRAESLESIPQSADFISLKPIGQYFLFLTLLAVSLILNDRLRRRDQQPWSLHGCGHETQRLHHCSVQLCGRNAIENLPRPVSYGRYRDSVESRAAVRHHWWSSYRVRSHRLQVRVCWILVDSSGTKVVWPYYNLQGSQPPGVSLFRKGCSVVGKSEICHLDSLKRFRY